MSTKRDPLDISGHDSYPFVILDTQERPDATQDPAVSAGVARLSPNNAVDQQTAEHPTGGGPPPMAPLAMAPRSTLTASSTTTRRMRINIVRNTKGYSYDTTFEIGTDDPAVDLQEEMEAGLGQADRTARYEIEIRQRLDQNEST